MESQVSELSLGAVNVSVTRSTQGTSLEVAVKRPREAGETFEQAAIFAADCAANAYALAVERLAAIGLTPGKDAK